MQRRMYLECVCDNRKSQLFLNFERGGHGKCTNELRTHAKYTHKHVGVDWCCSCNVSRDLRCEIAILPKIHQNPSLRAYRSRSCSKPKICCPSPQITLISVDENSSHAHNFCQILRNHPWATSGASGGVWGGVNALRFHQSAPT